MTAPAQASTQPPWKVRWAAWGLAVFCIVAIPGTTRSFGLRAIHGAAQIAGIDNTDEPVLISPTNPPVIDQ